MSKDTELPVFESIVTGLLEQNRAVVDFLFDADTLTEMRARLNENLAEGNLHKAGIGNQTRHALNEEIRSDKIHWIDNASQHPAERRFLDTVESLCAYLNRTCYAGIRTHEFHYACFGAGAFYKRHIDRFRNDNARKFSMVTYLNPDWAPNDGGSLLLYTEGGPLSILPEFGKTVIFKSDLLEHEVLPAGKDRLSVTGWLK